MHCSYCGAPNPENNQFCGKCGKPLIIEPQTNEVLQKKRTPLLWILGIGGGMAALGVIILSILIMMRSGPFTPQPTSSPQPTFTPVLQAGDTRVRMIDGMLEVFIPGGTFEMGGTSGDRDEEPVHTVSLSPYWIDQTEVTNSQYQLCVQAGACNTLNRTDSFSADSYFGNGQFAYYPVIYVDWYDASDYCQWAGGRLPTEAEWEFAARGTEDRIYPWGDQSPAGILVNFCDSNCSLDYRDASVNDGYADTSPVGNYPDGASPFGVQDLAGNVWEWVADWFGDYPSGSVTDPQGPASGEFRVLRGGAWSDSASNLRASDRFRVVPDVLNNDSGFRCSRAALP